MPRRLRRPEKMRDDIFSKVEVEINLRAPPVCVGREGVPDIPLRQRTDSFAVFELGSGSYNFRAVTGNTVSEKTMQAIYEKIKTPYNLLAKLALST